MIKDRFYRILFSNGSEKNIRATKSISDVKEGYVKEDPGVKVEQLTDVEIERIWHIRPRY